MILIFYAASYTSIHTFCLSGRIVPFVIKSFQSSGIILSKTCYSGIFSIFISFHLHPCTMLQAYDWFILPFKPFYSPVECLDEIEKFLVNEICIPILESKTLEIFLDKMRDYTSFYASEVSMVARTRVSNLPDYGCPLGQNSCSNQSGLPRCLHKGTPFPFLLSFARLSMVITSCHKGLTSKVSLSLCAGVNPWQVAFQFFELFVICHMHLPHTLADASVYFLQFLKFVTNDVIVQYLKSNSTPEQNVRKHLSFFRNDFVC